MDLEMARFQDGCGVENDSGGQSTELIRRGLSRICAQRG